MCVTYVQLCASVELGFFLFCLVFLLEMKLARLYWLYRVLRERQWKWTTGGRGAVVIIWSADGKMGGTGKEEAAGFEFLIKQQSQN